MNDVSWQRMYEQYPVNESIIWLNNCGTTPSGSHITNAVTAYMKEYSQKGIFSNKYNFLKVKQAIQSILSELLNCNLHDIALIHNTAEGMNFISHGLSLEKGDEILLMENEYPSNVYPWEHWESKGVKIKFIATALTPNVFLQNFENALTPKTKLVSLSSVHWCTGMPLPIKEISEMCKAKAVDFCLDGAQGVGHVEVDINSWGITFLSFSAWKWLLGPLGMGVLVVPEKNIQKLKPVFKGTGSVVKPHEYLPYQHELQATAERYMFSTVNFLDWIYFLASLECLKQIGFGKVKQRIYQLSAYLSDRLTDAGFSVLSSGFYAPDGQKLESGIVVVENDGWDVKAAHQELTKNNIVTAVRLGRLRMAPHIYNSFEQLDKVVRCLKEFFG